MDASIDAAPPEPAFELLAPDEQTKPLVLASPHSGNRYPDEFLAAARLDPRALRKSEDCFVDEIFAGAPSLGMPLIRALFPRAFLDVNREAYELDPEMFADSLPPYVNTRSPRVAAGLGTIARVVANGEDIYRGKLRFAEAVRRVERYYTPYHDALRRLVEDTRDRFGHAVLIDCHSMPSTGLGDRDHRRSDIVLGDCFGNSCAPSVIDTAERFLRGLGYTVGRNAPYAGGYTTRHYGRPRQGIHALQIEISRDLYMDEATLSRLPFLNVLTRHMHEMVDNIAHLPPGPLAPR
ncbi:N-formylglutamate amidohydrolase [Roseomonas genomospecies 6]|uniref:N-formylglutamate amidohydrolase n=1 Tax=Roseomonas genomospecies 6 TaxID=214106 RepID=A0A9W7KMZ1_9PROT|nr:N-formylglutamate amidohydrolase [Roseomonas genomospecies 6]KAA0675751.1 N-formylglutamate amidohydrolase [Roseomonas genomospecies 6]